MAEASIIGVYEREESAADALDGLKNAGFRRGTFDVLTGTPYPEGAFGEHLPQHRLFRFPMIGALLGFTVAILLTAGTQIAYPLITGGKPILSIFAMLVITYELTMLFAVLSTVGGIIFESRLPNFKKKAYDTRVTEGYIGVVLDTDQTRLQEAEKILRDNGAVDVKTA